MISKIFRSRFFICFFIGVFSFFLVSNSFSAGWAGQVPEWEKELQAGVELYNEGRFSEAIQHFNRVLSLTQDENVLINVHYNLSICHFYSGDKNAAEESVKNLLRLDPSREAPEAFPTKYRKLYSKVKKQLSREAAPAVIEEPQEEEVQEAQVRTKAVKAKSKKRKVLFIAGGAALATVVAVTGIFLLSSNKGHIECNSTPSGASVLLDGSSTGQVTPCTVKKVEPGTHTVVLALDGYLNHQQSVDVQKGKTANVSVNLTPHTIAISDPKDHTVWTKGSTVSIAWSVDGPLDMQNTALHFFSGPAYSPSSNLSRISPAFSSSGSGKEALDRLERQSRAPASAEQGSRPSAFEMRSRTAEKSMNERHDLLMRRFRMSSAGDRGEGMSPRSPYPGQPFLKFQGREPAALASVTIDLYKGGGKVRDIAPSTSNTGSYSWQAPSDVDDAGDYSVRISCSTDPSVYAESDYFWLSYTGTLNATSNPTGAAVFWDGWNSGETTNATLTLPVGSQSVKYTRDLFRDFETSVNMLQDQTTDLHKDLDPDSFYEDLSDGQAQFWTAVAGSADWIAEDGVYKFKSVRGSQEEQVGYYKAGSAKFYGNFTYEVDADKAVGYDLGVVGISIGVEENHYRFILLDVSPGAQQFSIWYQRATGGEQGALTGWTYFNKINETGWNDLKIIRTGNTLFFYINEYEVAEHLITYLKDWVEVGLWGYTYGLPDEVHFDNIQMTLNSSSSSSHTAGINGVPSKIIYNENMHPAFPPGKVIKK